MDVVWIGLGGAAGAVARYLVDGAVAGSVAGPFPWGTLVVNVSGSFLVGILFAVITERAALPPTLRGPLMIGFVGAYTTFSTVMLETLRLVEAGSPGLAVVNVVGSVALGLTAVVIGIAVGRTVAGA